MSYFSADFHILSIFEGFRDFIPSFFLKIECSQRYNHTSFAYCHELMSAINIPSKCPPQALYESISYQNIRTIGTSSGFQLHVSWVEDEELYAVF